MKHGRASSILKARLKFEIAMVGRVFGSGLIMVQSFFFSQMFKKHGVSFQGGKMRKMQFYCIFRIIFLMY